MEISDFGHCNPGLFESCIKFYAVLRSEFREEPIRAALRLSILSVLIEGALQALVVSFLARARSIFKADCNNYNKEKKGDIHLL